ncbi:hypothetical protein A0U90_04135 [Kozakia baliensis]|nr:hypothetical protein A0U90_04135 [Kozakia baliensis]
MMGSQKRSALLGMSILSKLTYQPSFMKIFSFLPLQAEGAYPCEEWQRRFAMSHKGHSHKHAPGRHKAPHYGAAHYVVSSGRRGGQKMMDLSNLNEQSSSKSRKGKTT